MLEREHVDAIVLAGTDLALLFDDRETEFPAIDCAALHIAEVARAMMADGTEAGN